MLKDHRLTVKQVCEICQISRQTFFRRWKDGLITATREGSALGSRVYVTADVLANALGLDEIEARAAFSLPPEAPETVTDAPEATPEPSTAIPEATTDVPTAPEPNLAEILREANSRGSLIQGHPDIVPVSPDARAPFVMPRNSFHNPSQTAQDRNWKTAKARPATGYSNPVDAPAFAALHALVKEK